MCACRIGTEPMLQRRSGQADDTAGVSHSRRFCPAPLDKAEKLLSLQVALKCADVGHLSEGLEVSKLSEGHDATANLEGLSP